MRLQACRILQIIGLESDLYAKIKGQFGAHDFGAKHPRRDLLLTHSCTILMLDSCYRVCCEHWNSCKTEKNPCVGEVRGILPHLW